MMQNRPICIPTVRNDRGWDYCFHLSQQPKNPSHQQIEEWYSTSASGESGEDAEPKEEAISIWSLPVEKLAQSQKKVAQLIKDKMNIQANKELIRCVSLSRIIFGEEHWKCAQAVASLAYGYLTLRGLPCQAKKHAESAKTILLTWKGNIASEKEKKEILEALVMIYYTLGVAWLLQNHGQEAYVNLQKAERNMKELREFYQGSSCGFQVSENELAVALGRASLATQRLNLALTYFEKAIGNVIAAKGDRTSDLESLYEEIAQIEQLRKTHNQGIQYMQQAHYIYIYLFIEVSPQTREMCIISQGYAMSGVAQHMGSIFMKNIMAYQATVGPEEYETLTITEDFCKWPVQNGDKQVTCLRCLMIQFLFGNEHSRSSETRSLLTLLGGEVLATAINEGPCVWGWRQLGLS
ncbi:LOW QUALITY PROTEIN: tetratricopeptide repeat protein 23-like [Sorex araneus]|uniref:LOW QUALITY PROTEIN: tetratricopeptide repeat protein 23-like n=1 Tax=Sorex araneus TaxID=42254 RepID=UPI00243402CE|nr:LOW QUALITY PROTEIN: tetratricopeptide repeat protein 23-like [Sorex araneus]